jgi:mercuric ion transport protein
MADPSKTGKSMLATSVLSAVLASTCCLGPLVLVGLGVSGAWIGNLRLLEPYRPLFLIAAAIALFFAYRGIFLRPAADCEPGEICAMPRVKAVYKALFVAVVALIVIAISFPYVLPWFY